MKNKKKIRIICLVLVGVFLIAGIVSAIIFGKINENSKNNVMKYFHQQLTKYEKLVNENDAKNYSLTTALANKSMTYRSDYVMDIFVNEDKAQVQMRLNNSGKLYLLKFNGLSFDEYDGKKYVMQLGSNGSFQYVYEIQRGKIVKTYKSTEASFFNLCNGLQKYLPDSYCGKDNYSSFDVYTNNNKESTFIISGDNSKILFNKNYYFEETAEKFVRIKPNETSYIFRIPGNIR